MQQVGNVRHDLIAFQVWGNGQVGCSHPLAIASPVERDPFTVNELDVDAFPMGIELDAFGFYLTPVQRKRLSLDLVVMQRGSPQRLGVRPPRL
jgi:hypothetical protein